MRKTRKRFTSILSLILSLAMMATIAVLPASAAQTKTSFDFFKAMGSTKAVNLLNNSKYSSYVKRGSANDATNLQNMYRSLEIIERTNYWRSKEGKKALLVNDSMMAMAQVNCDYAAVKGNHSGQYNKAPYYTVENLNEGYSNPKDAPDGWYNEKHTGAHNGGHYKSMMGKSGIDSDLSGAAINSGVPVNEEIFGLKQYNLNGEKAYTVSQYRSRLKNYMNQVGSTTSAKKSTKSQNNTPTATGTVDHGDVQMKYTITPVSDTKKTTSGTTKSSNGTYTCKATTIVNRGNSSGNPSNYKNNNWKETSGKVTIYITHLYYTNITGALTAEVTFVNGTNHDINISSIPQCDVYIDGQIVGTDAIWILTPQKTIRAHHANTDNELVFGRFLQGANLSSGTLKVESTINYTYA